MYTNKKEIIICKMKIKISLKIILVKQKIIQKKVKTIAKQKRVNKIKLNFSHHHIL